MATFPRFSLLDYLEKNAPVVCDGAKSLPLQSLGFPETNACFMANLTHPDLVCKVHHTYLAAGAAILRTNTEGAHRLMLECLDLVDRGENINNNGMILLREGVGMRGLPAGSVSSIKKDITGTVSERLLEKAYGEQLIYQADTGAKFMMFSDFEEIEDLKIAVRVSKRSVQKQVVAHFKITLNPSLADLLHQMESLQKIADFIGVQASWQHPNLSEVVASLVDHFGIVSVLLDEAAPCAVDEISKGFSQMIESLLPHQPAIIGGGNYTTPPHIQMMAKQIATIYES